MVFIKAVCKSEIDTACIKTQGKGDLQKHTVEFQMKCVHFGFYLGYFSVLSEENFMENRSVTLHVGCEHVPVKKFTQKNILN